MTNFTLLAPPLLIRRLLHAVNPCENVYYNPPNTQNLQFIGQIYFVLRATCSV